MACKCKGKCIGLLRSNYITSDQCYTCEIWFPKSNNPRCNYCNQILRHNPRNGLNRKRKEINRIG